MKDLNPHLLVAIKAAIAGGVQILQVYNHEETEVKIKEDKTPLTQADQKSNEAIMQFLVETGINVLSEEGKAIDYETRKKWPQLWIVDPLDGTKEFIKRNGEFTVNIALVQNGVPILGVIYVPVTGDLYFAAEGLGAYQVSRVGGQTKISSIENIVGAADKLPISQKRPFTVVGSRSHMSPETEAYIAALQAEHGTVDIQSRGSSLKICMVASGKADVYPRFAPTMEWDTAAGHAIARMAGFEVLQYNSTEPLQYNKPDLLNPWFVVK